MKETTQIDLCHTAPIGMVTCSPEGKIIFANLAISALLGYSNEELLDLNILEIIHPDSKTIYYELNQQLFAGKQKNNHYRLEQHLISKSGRLIHTVTFVSLHHEQTTSEDYAIVHFIDNSQLYSDSNLPFLSAMEQINNIIRKAGSVDRNCMFDVHNKRLCTQADPFS